MSETTVLSLIDEEIARLQKVRSLLAASANVGGISSGAKATAGRGTKTAAKATPVKRPRRKLSAEGRGRIAEAQKKRWAALKKSQGK